MLRKVKALSPSVPKMLGFADGNDAVIILDSVGIPFVGHNAAKLKRFGSFVPVLL
jgi:hypothetical protein